MNYAQPTLRKVLRRDQGSSDLDPAKLGATLRELSVRAHQLVRAMASADERGGESKKELAEIYAQIVRLQRSLNAHHLDELATYVAALRQRVAESLG
jgi:hypothetical protein